MANKTVTLILFRADRVPWIGDAVRLQVTEVSRAPLKILVYKRLAYGTSTEVRAGKLVWPLTRP